jgi:hypothetical protein
MNTRMEDVINPTARFDARAAILGGLIAGGVLWLLSHGTPWFASGMITPTMMGRDLKPAGMVDASRSALTTVTEFGVAVVYTFVLGLLVTHLRGMWAVAAGGVAGVGLYLINYAVFHLFMATDWTGSEAPVLVTHIVFGMIASAIYKGLAARRSIPAPGS